MTPNIDVRIIKVFLPIDKRVRKFVVSEVSRLKPQMSIKAKDRTYEDVPSFRQYCKSLKDFENPIISYVQKLWLPNQYPSVSLVTERFLLRIHAKSDIYAPLLECLEEWEHSEACIFVRLLDPKSYEFEVDCLEDESSTWTELGDFGREIVVKERKKRSRGVKAKT